MKCGLFLVFLLSMVCGSVVALAEGTEVDDSGVDVDDADRAYLEERLGEHAHRYGESGVERGSRTVPFLVPLVPLGRRVLRRS